MDTRYHVSSSGAQSGCGERRRTGSVSGGTDSCTLKTAEFALCEGLNGRSPLITGDATVMKSQLHPMQAGDEPFLYRLYASTRSAERALVRFLYHVPEMPRGLVTRPNPFSLSTVVVRML